MLSTAKLVIASDWQPVLHAHKFDRFDALWNLNGDVVKRANSTEVLRVAFDGHTVFLKKYWVTNLNQLISGIMRGALFGTSKVRREFENMQRLRAWGLDAPAPVAWGEQRRAGWLIRSVLVSEGIPNPVPLDRYIACDPAPSAGVAPSASDKRRRELIDKLADCVRKLHEHHFVHFDLYWRNILLTSGELTHFALIDSHKGHCWRAANERRSRAQDLATLDAPAPAYFRRTERLRFFLRYSGHERLQVQDKELVRLVLQTAQPMRTVQLRRVREAQR